MRSRRCGVNKSASQLSLPHISEDLIKSDTFPPTRLPYVTPTPPQKKKKKDAASVNAPVRLSPLLSLRKDSQVSEEGGGSRCFRSLASPMTFCTILATMERTRRRMAARSAAVGTKIFQQMKWKSLGWFRWSGVSVSSVVYWIIRRNNVEGLRLRPANCVTTI